MNFQDPRKKIRELEYEYTFDKTELGKVMVIASLTLLIVSVHTLMTLQPAIDEAKQTEQRLNQLDAVVSTDAFNDSLEAIQDLQGTNLGEQMQYAVSTFRGMQTTTNDQQAIYSELEQASKTYQWLVLTGIIGLVAGLATIYV